MTKTNRKQCPSCKERIHKHARKCPYCQTKQPDSMTTWLIASVLTVVLFIVCMGGLDSFFDTDTPASSGARAKQSSPDTLRQSALNMAKRFVKEQLRSPGSAEWPGLFESADHVTSLGNNRYRVRSWVDSQNAFGALIRTHYTATLRTTDGNGKNWTLESLDLDQ